MADYTDVARDLYGTEPPDWLVKTINIYGSTLVSSRRNEDDRRTRNAMKARLRRVVKAAEVVLEAVGDAQTLTLLVAEAGQLRDDVSITYSGVDDVRRASELAIASLNQTAGPDKARVSVEIMPRVTCALMIQILIEEISGRVPTGRGKPEQSAADKLWRASGGGDFTGHAGKNLISWENCFEATKRASAAHRRAFRETLKIHMRVAIPPSTPPDCYS